MRKLGIIGGVGPMATALFMEYIIEMTDAKTDSEHIDMLIHNCPQIPDRTQFILGKSTDDPSIKMIDIGKMLEQNGCELIAVPCITANFFYDKVQASLTKPLLDGVAETSAAINSYNEQLKTSVSSKAVSVAVASCAQPSSTPATNPITKVGIMATDGTISSGLFQKALNKYNIDSVVPSPESQKLVMSLIYDDVKGGRPIDDKVLKKIKTVSDELWKNGASLIILGCTELSVIGRAFNLKEGYVDALRALAQTAVVSCGDLKSEFKNIVMPVTSPC
ncbi:MAG: aspartate/glutamate racemase family protein [Clostridia bacterium]|nr:aspartate/glutamate racemase family protein [Clostridia bacterium]